MIVLGEQASSVLSGIQRDFKRKKGIDWPKEEEEEFRRQIEMKFERVCILNFCSFFELFNFSFSSFI